MTTNNTSFTSFDDWLDYGMEQGWCGPAVCETHDGVPMTEEEEDEFMDGADPCLHVIRLYDSFETKFAVEENHPPSVWRNTNRKG